MSDGQRHIRGIGPESGGTAPGRGRLAGRRILIVGGGQRIFDAASDPVGNGRSMALLCAREGARVAVADARLASAEDTVALIEGEGGSAFAIAADIGRAADVERMIGAASEGLGGLDGMVLNVGIGVGALDLEGVDLDGWDQTMAVNVRGPMLCCRYGLPKLADDGSIVFISSIAGLTAGSRIVAYDASKAALSGLMRHVALEGSRRGIRANVICPGLVDTPLGRLATAGRESRGRTRIPFGRQATGWEVANAALFFLSEDSAYVTAQILAVDGGVRGF